MANTTIEPMDTKKTEPKVKWAVIGTYLAGLVGLGLVNALTGDNNALLLEALPDYIEPFVIPLVPSAAAWVAGYSARHQWRQGEGDSSTGQLG